MANLLLDPLNWKDGANISPPPQWDGTAYKKSSAASFLEIQLYHKTGLVIATGDVVAGTVTGTPQGVDLLPLYLVYYSDTSIQFVSIVPNQQVSFSFVAEAGGQLYAANDNTFNNSVSILFYGTLTITPVVVDVDLYNCNCSCGYPTTTLAEMRAELAPLMGYSAQVASLADSIKVAIRAHLNLHQRLLLQDMAEIQNVRYFSWAVEAGVTKYCVDENLETCRNLLSATRVAEAYVVHDGTVITRLLKGIPFQNYEGGNPQSTPMRYEVRSCIEIWPPPSRAMTLVIKGTMAAVDLVNDGDKIMVDKTALMLRVLAFWKGGKGHADAANYMGQYWAYLGTLSADANEDCRHVPNDWRRSNTLDQDILTHVMQRRVYAEA